MALQKTERASADIQNENLEKLRAVFPQFVKDGQIDFDALAAFFNKEGLTAGPEKYGLSWAGKNDAFKAIRMPATGTLVPQEKGSKDWDTTQNLFIEGDNLEVLKLLQKHYRDQIKMIYIDPPYNTGKDFIYTDNFTENKSDYYERTGQSEGGVKLTSNLETNGRYHSDWLTMMYPRLFLAKNLLKEDGVIFISIDDNEVANLRLVMDEIFGEENFIASFLWKKKGTTTNVEGATVSSLTEYILCYGRNENGLNFRVSSKEDREYPHEDAEGKYRLTVIEKKNTGDYERQTMVFPIIGTTPREGKRWQIGEEKARELESRRRFILQEGVIKLKIYDFEDNDTTSANPNLLFENGSTESATRLLRELLNGSYFDNPKPVELVRKLICLAQSDTKDDITLDFFAGSGTTAHAVMDLNAEDNGNRKWICVQIPEETAEESEAHKAGFKTIADISRARIRRAGEKVREEFLQEKLPERRGLQEVYGYKDREIGELEGDATRDLDIGFKSFALASSNYRQWSVLTEKDDEEKLKAQMKLFADKPLVDGANEESVVYEVLLKEGFDLNAEVKCEERGGAPLWLATSGDRIATVTLAPKLSREQIDALNLAKGSLFVCLDSALDDSLKVNLGKNFNLKVI